ncbi:MDIS1-interacting receptor like kinase 2-like [Durio zibethinus]|uniref:non-specific serine/threonine protein kinase n=1 Tax=Durio zibethinus TaxID=66656 RepID=A0A6P6ALP6_DURZI|nr:MDIS1-interacting receptor like kinase 2-like [Durio zibethinus]
MKVDERCDVYSFGVLSMEILIGRYDGDLISSLSSLSLASASASASTSFPNDNQQILLKDVIDQRLSPPVRQVAKNVVSITKLACACLNGNPQLRPTMQQVAQGLTLETPSVPIPNIKEFHEASFDALSNNKGLCGNATGLMPCVVVHRKSTKVIIFIMLPLFGLILLLFIMVGSFLILCQKKRTRKSESMEAKLGDIFTVWGYNGRILYENIIEATEDFSSNNCIGSGGYGAVYKAVLPIGEVVAAKKLHQSEDSMISNNLIAFESEIHALSEIRHRNIVKLRGSLRMVLSNKDKAMELDWEKRLNVVKRVTNALSYMHHGHSPPIIHPDISSDNFLDLDYVAYVSDFRIARLL